MGWLGTGIALIRLIRHWEWIVPLAGTLARKEVAIAGLHPGETATLATTEAAPFGESLTLSLVVTRNGRANA